MISFRAFGKSYGRAAAVGCLTLDVSPGEAVALLGPNGSGKTTCLKAAAGLLCPTSGSVRVGEPLRPATEPAARRGLSYLPQRVAFPESLSGREVVDFYRRLRGLDPGRTDAVLRFASLNGAAARATGAYSGGMLQRLGLAVAMLPEAPVLLLDEPTAALDPDGLCSFYGVVESRKRRGQTVLFTSHALGDAERLADRFAILVDGNLRALLDARTLAQRLSERGVMRLRLDGAPADLPALLGDIAPRALWAGEELIVPGPTAARPAVLDRVRATRATIRALTIEEGRLDALYRELVPGAVPVEGRE